MWQNWIINFSVTYTQCTYSFIFNSTYLALPACLCLPWLPHYLFAGGEEAQKTRLFTVSFLRQRVVQGMNLK